MDSAQASDDEDEVQREAENVVLKWLLSTASSERSALQQFRACDVYVSCEHLHARREPTAAWFVTLPNNMKGMQCDLFVCWCWQNTRARQRQYTVLSRVTAAQRRQWQQQDCAVAVQACSLPRLFDITDVSQEQLTSVATTMNERLQVLLTAAEAMVECQGELVVPCMDVEHAVHCRLQLYRSLAGVTSVHWRYVHWHRIDERRRHLLQNQALCSKLMAGDKLWPLAVLFVAVAVARAKQTEQCRQRLLHWERQWARWQAQTLGIVDEDRIKALQDRHEEHWTLFLNVVQQRQRQQTVLKQPFLLRQLEAVEKCLLEIQLR